MSGETTIDDVSGTKRRSNASRVTRWSVVVMASSVSDAVGRVIELGSTPTVIERVTHGEAQDGRMSRRHATARVEKGAVTIRDGADAGQGWKRSNNNTFVGEDALGDAAVTVAAGDLVRTGRTLWMVVRNAVASPPGSLLVGVSAALDDARMEVALAVARTASRLKSRRRVTQALLVTGPRGSGKQVVAREAHRVLQTKLAHGQIPFREVSAPSMGDGTAAADLFGVVERYATDVKARAGFFEQADGGVLLLDEIGDAPAAEQAKLLHVLEERKVTPLGGSAARTFDCLVVAATNRDLTGDDFRDDLRDRLGRFRVHLPPLAQRPEDIPVIAAMLARKHGLKAPLPWDVAQALLNLPWPGNVRQLDVVIERLTALCGMQDRTPDIALLAWAAAVIETAAQPPLKEKVRRGKPSREELLDALRRHDGNKTAAAREFGKDRRQVLRWMDYHGIGDEDVSG